MAFKRLYATERELWILGEQLPAWRSYPATFDAPGLPGLVGSSAPG